MAKRGRPRKATPEQMNIINDGIQQITGQTFDDFYKSFQDKTYCEKFASKLSVNLQQLANLTQQVSANGKYQPILSEQLFQQFNINPKAASSSDIANWLLAPQYHSKELRELSQYLSYAVGQYQRSIYYLNTIKEYNYKLLPCDSDIENKVDSDTFIHLYNLCLDRLQKMNIRYQIPKVDLSVMRDGVAFYWVNETDDNITLIQLPSDYCHITAPWTYGFLFSIDLVVFDKLVSVPDQIPELNNAYNKFVEMRKQKMEGSKLAPYQYYAVSPDNGWCFTFDPTIPDKIPPLSSSMSPALDVLSYKELLKNQMALDLFKVIALKIPLDKDNKKLVLTYPEASDIVQAIQALLPENIRAFASPFDSNPINTDQSTKYSNIVDVGADIYFSSAGLQKVQFGGGDVKQGSALNSSSSVDFNFASKHMYRQYENFINWQLALKTKGFKFKVQMFGNALNKEKELEQAINMVRTCNTNFTNLFACAGIEPFEIKSMLLLEKQIGYRDLMTPLISGFNSKQTNDGGRPTKLDSDKTDSGIQTSDNNSNNEKGE